MTQLDFVSVSFAITLLFPVIIQADTEGNHLARLDADFHRLVKEEKNPLPLRQAAKLLEQSTGDARWTESKKAIQLLRKHRSKAAVPLLLKGMIKLADERIGRMIVPMYADTLTVLTGVDIASSFKDRTQNIAQIRQRIHKLIKEWWIVGQDKVATNLESFSSEQLQVVVTHLLEVERRHSRHLRDREMDVYSVHQILYYQVMKPSSADEHQWFAQDLNKNMVPTLLHESGYVEKPTGESKNKVVTVHFDAISMLASLRKSGNAELLDKVAADEEQHNAARLACVLAVYRAGEKLDSKTLLTILKGKGSVQNRLVAALALRYAREPEVVPALIKQLDDKNNQIRTAAACALRDVLPKSALPKLKTLINDLDDGQSIPLVFKVISEYENVEAQGIIAEYLEEALQGGAKARYISRALSAFGDATSKRWIKAGAHPKSYYREKAREALAWWNTQKVKR